MAKGRDCSVELIQLKYFKAVARTGKIAAAAQELFLSPPALSTSIARLEKELGTPLFDRTGNRITLNPQGEIFLRHVNEVFDALDRAKTELHHSLLRQQQHIRLANTGSNLWMDLITAFSQEFPQYTLTCTSTDYIYLENVFAQYTFLLAEEGELSANSPFEPDSLFLFEDQPAILVHPDHPLAALKQVTVSQLRNEHLILPMQNTPRRERLMQLLLSGGIDPDTTSSFNYLISRNMVQQNIAIAFTTVRSRHVNLGDLKVVPLENTLTPWRMRLYWMGNQAMTEAELTFRAFVEEYYRA